MGVLGHKHIPLSYKLSSVEQRKYLLQGLLDSGGHAGKTSVEFCTILPELSKDVSELVRSLGMKVIVRENKAYLCGRHISQLYRLDIRATSKDIFWFDRKKADVCVKHQNYNKVRYITNITPLEVIPSRCLQVSNSDGLFLCGGLDFVLTHNSMLCENIAVNAALEHGDVKVLFLPLEMSNQQVLERMAQSITGLPIVADPFFTMEMSRSDEAKLKSAVEKVTDKILFPRQDKTIDVAHFVELVEEAVEVYGVEVVVLDHITALSVNEKDGLDWRSIDRTMAKLKELAVRLKVCVLTVSHISRDGENEDEVPKLKHIRAGNGIAQYSDVVLGMGRERSQNDTTVETIKLDRMLGRYVKFVLTYSDFKLIEKGDDVDKTEVDGPYAEKTDISAEWSLRQPAGEGSSLDVSKPGTPSGHSTSVGGVQETQVSSRLCDKEGSVPRDKRLHGAERPREDTSGVRSKPIDRLTTPVLVTPTKDKLDKQD
jgi:replicative DNA helicase